MTGQTQHPRHRRVSARAVVVGILLTVLGATVATASTASAKDHVTCVLNTDNPNSSSGQHGICLVVPTPDVDGL